MMRDGQDAPRPCGRSTLVASIAVCAALVAYVCLRADAACSLPGAAAMSAGAAERCFCAYAQYGSTARLKAACPS